MSHSIEKLTLRRLRMPLLVPYRVAFGLIEHFDTIVVEAVGRDGRVGLGEATILTGYTDETIDGSWRAAVDFAGALPSLGRDDAARELRRFGAGFPFAATAFGTALEMLGGSDLLNVPDAKSVALVGLLHAKSEESIPAELANLVDEGYGTVKVKVGFDVDKDVRLVKAVQRATNGRVRIRLDANQGYTAEQGVRFVESLNPADIELFEQPCPAGDWDSHLAVCRASAVPMMLDESIYSVADIEKAAALEAASYIKVKLMKLVTLDALSKALERIKALGMKPVLGNGVACDLGCWMEACVASRHVDNAGEMNGFLKAREPLLGESLSFGKGAVLLRPGFSPRLDAGSVERHQVETLVCRRGKGSPRSAEASR